VNNPLAVYLQDHLAGSVQAIQLVEFLRDQHPNQALGRFAETMLIEIKADQETLRSVSESVGDGASELKELAAWIAEKLTRLKLRAEGEMTLGTFEALEFLELGIHGKWALWRALDEIAASDARLGAIDFKRLAARAEAQRAEVEDRRLELARTALLGLRVG
jgi:hypothetical protein